MNPCLNKFEHDSSQQKKLFAVCKYNVNLGSDTFENYQKAVLSPEKSQLIEVVQEKFDSYQVNKTWELTKLPKGWKVLLGR